MRTADKTTFLFLLILALITRAVLGEDHVVVVDNDNFKSVVRQGHTVVEFYAPWCGHCKKLAPEYEEAAKKLKERNIEVVLAKCDATDDKNKPLTSKYGVTGFPMLKMFRDGKLEDPEDYQGPRDAQGIVDTILKAFGPPSVFFQDKKDYASFGSKEVSLVGVFSGEESPEFRIFYKVAEKLREEYMDIGHVYNPKLVPWCGDDATEDCSKPLIVVLDRDDQNITKYEGEVNEDALYEWIIHRITPKLLEVDPDRPRMMKKLQVLFKQPEPRLVGFALDSNLKTNDFKNALIAVDEGDDSFNTMFIDPRKNDKAAAFFGLKDEDLPAVVLHDHSANKKYIKKHCQPSEVATFISQWKAGELKLALKSEETPKDNSGPVKVVVAKEYNTILNSGKDVLLEFYAPWCGHCKKLQPIYDDLGKHFKDNEDVIIAKMNAAANDLPDDRFQVKGYPTLKYFQKNGKVIDYSGKRTLPDLISFVNTHLGVSAAKSKAPTNTTDEKKETEKKVEL